MENNEGKFNPEPEERKKLEAALQKENDAIDAWEVQEADKIQKEYEREKTEISTVRRSYTAMEQLRNSLIFRKNQKLQSLRAEAEKKRETLESDYKFRLINAGVFDKRVKEMEKLTTNDILGSLSAKDRQRLEQEYDQKEGKK